MEKHGFSGIWKLNPDKSGFLPNTKNQILTINTDGIDISISEELVNDRGEHLFISVNGRLDGSDSPVTGTMFADTVAYRLVDNHTIEGIAKKNGRICVKETAVLSEDENIVNVTYNSNDEHCNIQVFNGIFERVVDEFID
ncbi:MAG: hypothetical protein GX654_21020 [Desulfatiglans sp.]|jgi:hypothetical protein|nr:hypothetical protein [Desulfatiglans sp.]